MGRMPELLGGTLLLQVMRSANARALVPVRPPGVEICWPLSRFRQTVRMCAEPIQDSLGRKSLPFNYIAGFAICARFWHCACFNSVKTNQAIEDQSSTPWRDKMR